MKLMRARWVRDVYLYGDRLVGISTESDFARLVAGMKAAPGAA